MTQKPVTLFDWQTQNPELAQGLIDGTAHVVRDLDIADAVRWINWTQDRLKTEASETEDCKLFFTCIEAWKFLNEALEYLGQPSSGEKL